MGKRAPCLGTARLASEGERSCAVQGSAAVELGPSCAAEYRGEWVIAGAEGPQAGPYSRTGLRQLVLMCVQTPSPTAS